MLYNSYCFTFLSCGKDTFFSQKINSMKNLMKQSIWLPNSVATQLQHFAIEIFLLIFTTSLYCLRYLK